MTTENVEEHQTRTIRDPSMGMVGWNVVCRAVMQMDGAGDHWTPHKDLGEHHAMTGQ